MKKSVKAKDANFLRQFKGQKVDGARIHIEDNAFFHDFKKPIAIDTLLAEHIITGDANKIYASKYDTNTRITVEGKKSKFSYLLTNFDYDKLKNKTWGNSQMAQGGKTLRADKDILTIKEIKKFGNFREVDTHHSWKLVFGNDEYFIFKGDEFIWRSSDDFPTEASEEWLKLTKQKTVCYFVYQIQYYPTKENCELIKDVQKDITKYLKKHKLGYDDGGGMKVGGKWYDRFWFIRADKNEKIEKDIQNIIKKHKAQKAVHISSNCKMLFDLLNREKKLIKKQGGEVDEGKFKVGEVVASPHTKWIGTVIKASNKWGETETDAHGKTWAHNLELYNPEKHKGYFILPSTKKELEEKGLMAQGGEVGKAKLLSESLRNVINASYDWGVYDSDVITDALNTLRNIKQSSPMAKGGEVDIEYDFAQIILEQLGGRQFIAMTGAKDFVKNTEKQYLGFRIGTNESYANYVRITLTPKDTYDMMFGRIHGDSFEELKTYHDVYADMLQDIFTEYTGLYTTLYNKGGEMETRYRWEFDIAGDGIRKHFKDFTKAVNFLKKLPDLEQKKVMFSGVEHSRSNGTWVEGEIEIIKDVGHQWQMKKGGNIYAGMPVKEKEFAGAIIGGGIIKEILDDTVIVRKRDGSTYEIDKDQLYHILKKGGIIYALGGGIESMSDAEIEEAADKIISVMVLASDIEQEEADKITFNQKKELVKEYLIDIMAKGGGIEKTPKEAWIEISYKDEDGIDWAKDRLTEDKVNEILKKIGIKCKMGTCETGSGIMLKTGVRDIVFHVPANQQNKAINAIKKEFDRLNIPRKYLNIRSGLSEYAKGGEIFKVDTSTRGWDAKDIEDAYARIKQIRESADYDNTGRGYNIKVTVQKGDFKETQSIKKWLELKDEMIKKFKKPEANKSPKNKYDTVWGFDKAGFGSLKVAKEFFEKFNIKKYINYKKPSREYPYYLWIGDGIELVTLNNLLTNDGYGHYFGIRGDKETVKKAVKFIKDKKDYGGESPNRLEYISFDYDWDKGTEYEITEEHINKATLEDAIKELKEEIEFAGFEAKKKELKDQLKILTDAKDAMGYKKGGKIDDERISNVLKGYMDAALWASTDDEGEGLDTNYDVSDIPEEIRKAMEADVRKFMTDNIDIINKSGLPDEDIGHNLWLTRNHHGTGFWDRDLGDIGDKLTEAAHKFKESDLYVGDDEKIYVMAKGGEIRENKIKEAMKHPDKLGEGAKKRKKVGLTAAETFEAVRREFEQGTLWSGSGVKAKEREQAFAIGYSEARKIDPDYGQKAKGGEITSKEIEALDEEIEAKSVNLYGKIYEDLTQPERESVVEEITALRDYPEFVKEFYKKGGEVNNDEEKQRTEAIKELTKIKGIGKEKAEFIYAYIGVIEGGGLEAIKKAKQEDFAMIPGVSKELSKRIINHFKK